MKLLLTFTIAASLALTGCSAKTSAYMRPAEGPVLLAASPDEARVVFIRPSQLAKLATSTILDERGHFLGDAIASSWFSVTVPAGPHVFLSCGGDKTAVLRADLAPGRVYFVKVAPRWLEPRMDLMAITPRSDEWDKVDDWLTEATPTVPDQRAGQASLEARRQEIAERMKSLKTGFDDFDLDEVEARTLHFYDGA